MAAVIEGFEIFDGDWSGNAALVGVGERDADVTLADFGIDGDALLDRDAVLDAGFEHATLAVGRARADAGEVEADCSAAVTTLELDVGDARTRVEVAEAHDHRN